MGVFATCEQNPIGEEEVEGGCTSGDGLDCHALIAKGEITTAVENAFDAADHCGQGPVVPVTQTELPFVVGAFCIIEKNSWRLRKSKRKIRYESFFRSEALCATSHRNRSRTFQLQEQLVHGHSGVDDVLAASCGKKVIVKAFAVSSCNSPRQVLLILKNAMASDISAKINIYSLFSTQISALPQHTPCQSIHQCYQATPCIQAFYTILMSRTALLIVKNTGAFSEHSSFHHTHSLSWTLSISALATCRGICQ